VITIFTTAKPFVGRDLVNQKNALRSWKALGPEVEILLFGEGLGYQEVVNDLGITHIPVVKTTESGTPFFNSMAKIAKERGHHPIRGYVNCDIILTKDFLSAIRCISHERFLLVGQRWDIDVECEMDFQRKDWERELYERLQRNGKLHPPTGSDYFVYRGLLMSDLPPLVIGRGGGWDNQLIYFCRKRGIPVIDGSPRITIAHQNHNYNHHPDGRKGVWEGADAQINFQAGKDLEYYFTLQDADWILTSDGKVRRNSGRSLDQIMITWHALARHPLQRKILGLSLRITRRLLRIRQSIFRYGRK
jgi:pterin-4a-carbinolamine dehydratase